MTYKKKLIEVSLPLEAINIASAKEKSIRHGHPSTLHLWWARRPLAACRAVLFASLVDDPSSHPDKFPSEKDQDKERRRLHKIIEDLVKWENINNSAMLDAAKTEILKSTGGNPPPVLDPFCGGGSIPLEAQRLGLKAYASDLNPVAVLITKALIEIPPKFADQPPVNPVDLMPGEKWEGANGLAADVRYYGKWMRDEAYKRIGHLYPKIKLPSEYGGKEATVIAWLWTRTVKCPNPACGAQMPLVRSFWLSKKKGKRTWVIPKIDRSKKEVSFNILKGDGNPPDGTVNRNGATCIVCNVSVPFDHIRNEGKSGRLHSQLMAIVATSGKGRIYLSPSKKHYSIALQSVPEKPPESVLPDKALGFRVQLYGMTKHRDLFTPRQLVALTTFSNLVSEARNKVLNDALTAGMTDDGKGIDDGGTGATAYADAIAVYLSFVIDRLTMTGNTLVRWNPVGQKAQHAFGRQALPMVWDFAETNFFATATGSIDAAVKLAANPIQYFSGKQGTVEQLDSTASLGQVDNCLICTDPPYYDNIGYADLSDFFYIWLRKSLGKIYPIIFATVLTPKKPELIATPYRHGNDRSAAKIFFEQGLTKTFSLMREKQTGEYPLTSFYAFKQAEAQSDGNAISTGWETMLAGLISSGFHIVGTWPIRTEMKTRQVAMGTNALASSVVLVCRQKACDAKITTRRDFLSELKNELPQALRSLQMTNIAPVDLAQASIGPGMAIYSKYSKVIEADGSEMTIRTALALINQSLDEILAEQDSDYDPDTRWALAWFEQQGMEEGPYGIAEILSKAKIVAVNGLVEAGIISSGGGKVKLLARNELDRNWDPTQDKRLTVWEVTQYLIRELLESNEVSAANLAHKVGAMSESARDLAYRLYGICERKKWAQEALAYNSLVVAWPEIMRLAKTATDKTGQVSML